MGSYSLLRVTPPTARPLTVEQAKKACDLDETSTAHDLEIDALIEAAVEQAEQSTDRQLCEAEYELRLRAFPLGCRPIRLPKPPLLSVEAIKYLDADGDEQTLAPAAYRVSQGREPAQIELAFGQFWPVTYPVDEAVTIEYTAGYGDAEAVPKLLRQGLTLLVRRWFLEPDAKDELPPAVRSIFQAHTAGDEFTEYEPHDQRL